MFEIKIIFQFDENENFIHTTNKWKHNSHIYPKKVNVVSYPMRNIHIIQDAMLCPIMIYMLCRYVANHVCTNHVNKNIMLDVMLYYTIIYGIGMWPIMFALTL